MIKKSDLENDLASGMQKELLKQASSQAPNLSKVAECLHAVLEIFEAQGLSARANEVLELLKKISQSHKAKPVSEMPSINQLMEAGLTQRDMHEFAKGNPVAKAKLNLVLRSLGLSDHQIGKFIGTHNVMSEEQAKGIADPNRSFGKIFDWMENPNKPTNPSNIKPGEVIELESIAQPKSDWHTKGLTPEKMVENLKHHGTEFNMSDDLLDVDLSDDLLEVSDENLLSEDFED